MDGDRCTIDNHNEGTTIKTIEDRILDAAMVIFSKNGYNGATTIKIAEKAGVNEITIFRKFKSKENLLKTVIQKIKVKLWRHWTTSSAWKKAQM